MAIDKKKKPSSKVEKKKAKAVEVVVKKKKKAVVEDAPVQKKKKAKVEEVVTKKKKKSSKVEEKASSKKKSSKVAAKPAKKKAKAVKELPVYTPIKEKFNKTTLIEEIADRSEVDKKVVKAVMETFKDLMLGSITTKGIGEFQLPGLFKVKTVKKPAQKGGEKKKNPFKPGEMMITKAKPATIKVKILALKAMKDAALPRAK